MKYALTSHSIASQLTSPARSPLQSISYYLPISSSTVIIAATIKAHHHHHERSRPRPCSCTSTKLCEYLQCLAVAFKLKQCWTNHLSFSTSSDTNCQPQLAEWTRHFEVELAKQAPKAILYERAREAVRKLCDGKHSPQDVSCHCLRPLITKPISRDARLDRQTICELLDDVQR